MLDQSCDGVAAARRKMIPVVPPHVRVDVEPTVAPRVAAHECYIDRQIMSIVQDKYAIPKVATYVSRRYAC